MARYEAEEKIKARERMLAGTDPTPLVEEGKGESAAIIAEKAGEQAGLKAIAYLMGT